MRWDFLFIWLESLGLKSRRQANHSKDIDACLNCDLPLGPEDAFCAGCGQRRRLSKVTFWVLLREFFSSLFDLDNSAWRSLLYIGRPGFLAKEFMNGKRKKYFNPVRFFLLSLIAFFAAFTYFLDLDDFDKMGDNQLKRLGKSELKATFQEYRNTSSSDFSTAQLDSLDKAVFGDVAIPEQDTFQYSGSFRVLNVDLGKTRFLRKDMYELPIDSLMRKYDITSYKERLIFTQFVRTMRNLTGMVQFTIGNMIWGIVSTIFLLALFMKLLYIRRKRYYVEHIIVLFNIHTFTFLLLLITIPFPHFIEEKWADQMSSGAMVVAGLYALISLRNYYGQGWIKTFIKFLMMSIFYFITLLSMIAVVLLASALLFH